MFFSFDNIQTLLKSHRIGGDHQKKVLAIVVCSILCLEWKKESNIQFQSQNSPANWCIEYNYEPKTDMFVEKLSASNLTKCLKIEKDEEHIFNSFFESAIKDALEYVTRDLNENNEDSIDLKSKEATSKKRKLCENNHINDNVKSNRKICDRNYCKAKLKLHIQESVSVVTTQREDFISKEYTRAKHYLNVPNVIIDDLAEEHAVGAIDINPNTRERVSKVLDHLIEKAELKNKFPIKLRFSDKKVEKIVNDDPNLRKFILVTVDGLPYKILLDIIRNFHTCAKYGKRFEYLAEMNKHLKISQHNEYFQTYGCILPNI